MGRGIEACCRRSFTIRAFLDMCSQSQRLRASSRDRGRGSLLLMEGEATEMFGRLRIMPVASKKTEGIEIEGYLCAEGMGLRMSMSIHRSESVVNKYKFEYTIKTGFTPEVIPRKSGVECGWDLTSLYVVRPCLHTQWAHILELVRGGDKDLP